MHRTDGVGVIGAFGADRDHRDVSTDAPGWPENLIPRGPVPAEAVAFLWRPISNRPGGGGKAGKLETCPHNRKRYPHGCTYGSGSGPVEQVQRRPRPEPLQ